MVDNWTYPGAGALLPGVCLYCAGPATQVPACAACVQALPWNICACPSCALPLTHAAGTACRSCSERAPPFDGAFAAFRFEAPVQQAVHGLKYQARFHYARLLGRLMGQHLARRAGPLPELLIPVPLHPARLARRGYNQALLLAQELACVLAIDVEPTVARRVRATADQIGQTRAQRRRNMRGAFALTRPLAGRRIALIDDVMTTGATLGELARACREAGAASVEAWVAARVA